MNKNVWLLDLSGDFIGDLDLMGDTDRSCDRGIGDTERLPRFVLYGEAVRIVRPFAPPNGDRERSRGFGFRSGETDLSGAVIPRDAGVGDKDRSSGPRVGDFALFRR